MSNAIPTGESRPLPSTGLTTTFLTIGAKTFLKDVGATTSGLYETMLEFYNIQPDTDFKGGNDKYFFTIKFKGQKFFVAANEVGGLTIMLPEEY